jgi:hypothetical protein
MRVAILLILLILGSAYTAESEHCTCTGGATRFRGLKLTGRVGRRWRRRQVKSFTRLLFKHRKLSSYRRIRGCRRFVVAWRKVKVGAEIKETHAAWLRYLAKRAAPKRRAIILRLVAGGVVTRKLKLVVRRVIRRNRRARLILVIRRL